MLVRVLSVGSSPYSCKYLRHLWVVFDCSNRTWGPRLPFSAHWQASAAELAERGKKRNFSFVDWQVTSCSHFWQWSGSRINLWEQINGSSPPCCFSSWRVPRWSADVSAYTKYLQCWMALLAAQISTWFNEIQSSVDARYVYKVKRFCIRTYSSKSRSGLVPR